MQQPLMSIFISRPQAGGYIALPYSDDNSPSSALSNANLLCPRYAENDTSSAPPSPASIESFDILDSIAWRRGYTSHASGARPRRWRNRKHRAHIIAIAVVFALFLIGCSVGAYAAIRHEAVKTRETCLTREGGERCDDAAWARCIASNGVGYCEGVM
jgi:hypothetical protein